MPSREGPDWAHGQDEGGGAEGTRLPSAPATTYSNFATGSCNISVGLSSVLLVSGGILPLATGGIRGSPVTLAGPAGGGRGRRPVVPIRSPGIAWVGAVSGSTWSSVQHGGSPGGTDGVEGLQATGSSPRPSPDAGRAGYLMWMPDTARATMSRWISEVPSKMV